MPLSPRWPLAATIVASLASLPATLLTAQVTPSGSATGELIDIGGRSIHVRCTGSRGDSPTVVLIPGGGEFSSTWSSVQGLLASERTCSYDPAGTGRSDAASVPRTLRQEAFDLNRLLQRARIRSPFILVGHSLGGIVARIYADQFPGVAAIVLVDSLHEDSRQGNMSLGRWVRVRELSTGNIIPEPGVGAARQTNPEDDFLAEELQQLHEARLRQRAPLRDMPLFVITAGRRQQPPGTSNSLWTELQAEREAQAADLARLSSKGVVIRAERSGHNIQTDEPDVVARTIRSALESVRAVDVPTRRANRTPTPRQ